MLPERVKKMVRQENICNGYETEGLNLKKLAKSAIQDNHLLSSIENLMVKNAITCRLGSFTMQTIVGKHAAMLKSRSIGLFKPKNKVLFHVPF